MSADMSGANCPDTSCYPFRDSEEWAAFLIAQGLLEEQAWHDPQGWDGGIAMGRVFASLEKIHDELSTHPREIICEQCHKRKQLGEVPPADF